MPIIKVSLAFAKGTDDDVESTAGDVLDNMTGNANFPTPPVLPPALFSARQDFMQARADQAQGGTAATAEKNNKRAALIALLRQLAAYVQEKSDNDLAKLLSSGFKATSTSHAPVLLAKSVIKKIKTGMSGQLLVAVTRDKNAKNYELRFALIGAGGAPGPWQDGGLSSKSQSLPINGLTPGQTYIVQVRAIGGSAGYSDWSDSVSHMAV